MHDTGGLLKDLAKVTTLLGKPVQIAAGTEGNSVHISWIDFPDLAGAAPVLAKMAALGDNHYVRVTLSADAARCLFQSGCQESDFNRCGFEVMPSQDRFHRLPRRLKSGTIVYVSEAGAGYWLETSAANFPKIPRFLSDRNSQAYASLTDTERGLRRYMVIFKSACTKFKKLAVEQSGPIDDWRLPSRKFKSYRAIGNEGVSTAIEVEVAYATLISLAAMLDDRICNLAIELQAISGDKVWPSIGAGQDGQLGTERMQRRKFARSRLYQAFGDPCALKSLQDERNDLLHSDYRYAFVELDQDDVLLNWSFRLDDLDPALPGYVLAKDVVSWISTLLSNYLPWFLKESEQQISLFEE